MRVLTSVLLGIVIGAAGCTDEHETLMKELSHQSPVIRAGAVKSLSRVGDDDAYMLVSQSLEDPSTIVRIAAVWALHEFKGRDTAAPIVRATFDRDPEVREAAVTVLGRRKGEKSQRALVQMLLRGESNTKVRKLAFEALEKTGLSGERLSGEMAESQITMAREQLTKGRASDRARMVRMAGRSIHAAGIDLVIEGLGDRDQDVVIAALRVLDGRGGQQALSQLQLLLADQVEDIRLAAVQALIDYGEVGRKLLESALRDGSARPRLAALEVFGDNPGSLGFDQGCPLLFDPDPRVALSAASALAGRQGECDLQPLEAILSGEDRSKTDLAVGVLATLGSGPAVAMLDAEYKRRPSPDRLVFAAALVRAGQKRSELSRVLKREFDLAMNEFDLLRESWVKDKLPPAGVDTEAEEGEAPEEADGPDGRKEKSRLSDEELNALYKKHGLGPAGADSPRGIGDILASYEDGEHRAPDDRLLNPVSQELVDRLSMALDGLLFLSPEETGPAVQRALAVQSSGAVARVAQVLTAHSAVVKLDDALRANVQRVLGTSPPEFTGSLVQLLARSGQEADAKVLIASLDAVEWEGQILIIETLGRMKRPEAVDTLSGLLRGYSAIPAARALAAIGDERAVGALKESLGSAGPAEEAEILLALAKLGSRDQLPRLLEMLNASDSDVRRAAVRVMGALGGTQEMDALKGLRYNLDRLVRREVGQILDKGKTGEVEDGRQ